MNEIEYLEGLASAARREDVPQVDVSGRVTAMLRERVEDSVRPLAWVASLSFAAALPVAIVAYQILETSMDPLLVVFQMAPWVVL